MTMRSGCLRAVALLFLLLSGSWPKQASAYSLLTHEQLIDLTWQDSIVPLLKSRYPNLTPAELDRARAYAYGGCVIQDMGYYPFGDEFFSDLTHYARTGDFVLALFRNAHNANELAFAVGALSHYIGDSFGHSQATNRAVALEFPKLAKRYGQNVNYSQGRHEHVRTEFAFDIDQIAKHRLVPLGYLRHIGIKVPTHQLALAFYETYGLTEDFDASQGRRFNIRTYRFATRTLIPRVAYAVTLLNRNHEPPEPDTPDAVEIEKESAEAAKLYDWAAYRKRPGVETHLIAGVLWVLPKVGPLAMVAVKGPSEAAEADYMHSVVFGDHRAAGAVGTVYADRGAAATPRERYEFHGYAGSAGCKASAAESRPGHGAGGQARRLSAYGPDVRRASTPPDAQSGSADSTQHQERRAGVLFRSQRADHHQAESQGVGAGAGGSEDADCHAYERRTCSLPHVRRVEPSNQVAGELLP
jgi:hypothetical protein